jgi:hypothetical protein
LERERSNSENEKKCNKGLKHISMLIIPILIERRRANDGEPLIRKNNKNNVGHMPINWRN